MLRCGMISGVCKTGDPVEETERHNRLEEPKIHLIRTRAKIIVDRVYIFLPQTGLHFSHRHQQASKSKEEQK